MYGGVEHILTIAVDRYGYEKFGVPPGKRSTMVHLAVLTAFVGPRPAGKQCAHLDGNQRNNRVENLAWVTPSENNLHKRSHGTMYCGERHCRSKLTAVKVVEIRARRNESSSVLAREFGVSPQLILRIWNREYWRHIE